MIFKLAVVSFLIISGLAHAEDIGKYGRTYLIAEKNGEQTLKDEVAKKMAGGEKEKMIAEAQRRFYNQLDNIPPVSGVSLATKSSVRMVDLSQVVTSDILDEKGSVVVRAGTKINPAEIKPLAIKIFFIDARVQKQLDFVKSAAGPDDKILLTAGSLWKAQKFLDRNVYLEFEFARRMQVNHTPSVVSQAGLKYKIEEILL